LVVKKAGRISCMDYIHEKVEESRHNQTLAYLMFVTGVVFFVGGVLETVITTENPDWFLFFPYKITPPSPNFLGLFMVFSGFILLVLGMALSVHYVLEGAFFSGQFREIYVNEKGGESKKRVDHRRAKPFAEEVSREHARLGECKKHLVNHMGLSENDSTYYCSLLGARWRELLVEEAEYHAIR